MTELMTYSCWESSFKAVVVSQRAGFESSRLSVVRERWVSLDSCLPRMVYNCLSLQRLKSCMFHNTRFASWLCEVFVILCWRSSGNMMVLITFLFSYSHCSAYCIKYLPTNLLHIFSILLVLFISPLRVTSPLILVLLELVYQHHWKYLKDVQMQ